MIGESNPDYDLMANKLQIFPQTWTHSHIILFKHASVLHIYMCNVKYILRIFFVVSLQGCGYVHTLYTIKLTQESEKHISIIHTCHENNLCTI